MHADQSLTWSGSQIDLIPDFQNELRKAAGDSGQDVATLAFIASQMLAATRLLPESGQNGDSFRDSPQELTTHEWQIILKRLEFSWPKTNPPPQEVFAPPPSSLPPGLLERVKRIAFTFGFPAGQQIAAPAKMDRYFRYTLLTLGADKYAMSPSAEFDLWRAIADAVGAGNPREIYCAYGNTAPVAFHLAETLGVSVTLDIKERRYAALCACIAVADGLPLTVRERDPLAEQLTSAYAKSASDEVFDATVIFPPIGLRPLPDSFQSFGTSLPPAGTEEAQHVSFILARTRQIAICLLPAGFLFRTKRADQAFKYHAMKFYGLDTIIALPRITAPWSSAIQMYLVMFHCDTALHSSQQKGAQILFIDGREKTSSGRARHTDRMSPKLHETLAQRKASEIAGLASIDDIAAQDFNLSVERYVLEPEARRIRDLLSHGETVNLEDIAEITRPQALLTNRDRRAKEDRLSDAQSLRDSDVLFEIGVGDIDEAGLIRTPTTTVPASPELDQRAKSARLEAGDILIVIKGSVGKVGYVREIPDGPAWLASQSFAILRLRRRGPIAHPTVLFRFLSSALGQRMVQGLKVGSAIPVLQMGDLRRLQVLVPSAKTQAIIASQMGSIFDMQERIDQMRRELAVQRQTIWAELDRFSETVDSPPN